jgi:hypothetical protein
MTKRETFVERRKKFRSFCDSIDCYYRIETEVSIVGDYVIAKATVQITDPNDGVIYSSNGHKMVYFKEEISGIKDTSAYSAAETMAVSRAMGFLLDGEEEIATEEDMNQAIIYALSTLAGKLAISELEARRYVDTLSDELKPLAIEHMNKLIAKKALAAANESII